MKKIILSLIVLFSFGALVQAQSMVTFQVDMKYAKQNGLFNDLTNSLVLVGDLSPLGTRPSQYITLKDTAPIDSIYTAVVTFPASLNDKKLKYNFIINKLLTSEKEDRVREITLNGGDMELPAIKFNAYDW